MQTVAEPDGIESPRTSRWPAFAALWFPALRAHAPLFVLVGIHLACVVALIATVPGLEPPSPLQELLSGVLFMLIILPLSVVTLRFHHIATKVRPKHPLPALARDVWNYVREPAHAANGLVLTIAFVMFINLFGYLKASIPVIHPFSWDTTLMQWDRWLHFGHDPWRLLQPLLGHPLITFLITVNYHLWFMLMWIMVAGVAFSKVSFELRMRFFLAFMLTWGIGGNLLAIVFSSAGPCYYGLLGHSSDPYAPLLAYLHHVDDMLPIWAINTQDLLWQGYQGNAVFLGISAMPSMHNAAALLFALVGWKLDRRFGAALFAFAGFIFLGSIHLGWHYALDGYAGAAITLVMWWCAGIVTRRWCATAWVRDYAQAMQACGYEDPLKSADTTARKTAPAFA